MRSLKVVKFYLFACRVDTECGSFRFSGRFRELSFHSTIVHVYEAC